MSDAQEWREAIAESNRVIDQALDQAASYLCTCGAVEVPGATHLDYCESYEAEASTDDRQEQRQRQEGNATMPDLPEGDR